MDFVQVERTHFSYRGKKLGLRGFGIGTWLCLEHFMVGLPGSEQTIRNAFKEVYGGEQADAVFQSYQKSFLGEQDFRLMKECGVNFIRIPFNYRLFIDDNNLDSYKETGFAVFDYLFDLCTKYEIFAMIDLHAVPGSQNPDWHSDNANGMPLFWEYQVFRKQISRLWGVIASRYYDQPYLMGYDLLNEPAMASWPALNEFYEDTIAEIRTADRNHIIVLEGDQFSMDFSGLKQFNDSQIALGFHYYPTVWHPDLLDQDMERELRRQKIAAGLERLLAIKDQFNCPVLCGEFGYGAADCGGNEFAMLLLEDTVSLMEEREVDWLIWCYKDVDFMGMIHPAHSSDWMKMADEIKKEWTQDIEKHHAAEILKLIRENWYPGLTEDECYQLQFRLRACLYVLQANHILHPRLQEISDKKIMDMTDDFKYETCEINQQFYNFMKTTLLRE